MCLQTHLAEMHVPFGGLKPSQATYLKLSFGICGEAMLLTPQVKLCLSSHLRRPDSDVVMD